jgi:hypothetical protein
LSLEGVVTWPLTSVRHSQNMSHATTRGRRLHTRMRI